MRPEHREKTQAETEAYRIRTGAGAGLASALLTVSLMFPSGCVIPYFPLPKDPPVVNSIPAILPETVVPQQTTDPVEVNVGEGCQHLTFSATVIDYDGAAELHFKWILTAKVSSATAGTTSNRTIELVESSVTASELPIDTIVPGLSDWAPNARVYKDLSLDLTRERLLSVVDLAAIAPTVGGPYSHDLSLWVSDRSFEPGVANTNPQTPEGQGWQPAESASWFIEIEDKSCTGDGA